MSAKTTYNCNLCRKEIEIQVIGPRQGYALRWARNHAIGRDELESTTDWLHCPIHLCVGCLDAVAEIREDLRSGGN